MHLPFIGFLLGEGEQDRKKTIPPSIDNHTHSNVLKKVKQKERYKRIIHLLKTIL